MKRLSVMLLSLIFIFGGIIGCTQEQETQVNEKNKDSTEVKVQQTDPPVEIEATDEPTPTVIKQEEEKELNFFTEDEATSLGVWWWGTATVENEADFKKRLDFIKEHKITEVYLTYDEKKDDAVFHKAVKTLNEAGIRTSALTGDASWVTQAGYDWYVGWLEKLQKYQDNAKEDEKFVGLHVDVEPHAIPEYRDDPTPFLPVYMKLVDTSAEFAKKNKMTSEFDLPMWYVEEAKVTVDGEEMLMVEYIIRNIDTIGIMSYRDTAVAQYSDSARLITLIKKYGKKVVMGSETGPTGESEFVTYQEEGQKVLASELSKLRLLLKESLGENPYGLAIHWMDSWIELKE